MYWSENKRWLYIEKTTITACNRLNLQCKWLFQQSNWLYYLFNQLKCFSQKLETSQEQCNQLDPQCNLWRLDLWASMRSFNGDFPPWRCSGRKRRIGERRRHPLGNKPWKKELHHQDEPWIRSLEWMLQWRKRKRERKREGGARNWRKKKGEKLNWVVVARIDMVTLGGSF